MKTILILMGMVFSIHSYAQVQSDTIFRPYLSCGAAQTHTLIEVEQNTDKNDQALPFKVSVEKETGGKVVKFEQITAVRVPVKNKNILDLFEGVSEKEVYHFQLTVFRRENENGHVGYLIDSNGRRSVDCNYHITLRN